MQSAHRILDYLRGQKPFNDPAAIAAALAAGEAGGSPEVKTAAAADGNPKHDVTAQEAVATAAQPKSRHRARAERLVGRFWLRTCGYSAEFALVGGSPAEARRYVQQALQLHAKHAANAAAMDEEEAHGSTLPLSAIPEYGSRRDRELDHSGSGSSGAGGGRAGDGKGRGSGGTPGEHNEEEDHDPVTEGSLHLASL